MKRLKNVIIFNVTKRLRKHGLLSADLEAHPTVQNMKSEISALEGGVNFHIEQYPDGSWYAESTNIDGITTGSKDITEAQSLLKDAIFTYFEVPPQFCDDKLLRQANEPATIEQRVVVGA